MGFVEYTAIIASFLTIVSACINYIQWRSRENLIVTLKSRSQAAFNYFFLIAIQSDRIRGLGENEENFRSEINKAVKYAHSINGIADAARLDISSYSREHLDFVPVKEHPAHPYTGILPKPGSNKKVIDQ